MTEEKKPLQFMATDKEVKQIHTLANIVEAGAWISIAGVVLIVIGFCVIGGFILLAISH